MSYLRIFKFRVAIGYLVNKAWTPILESVDLNFINLSGRDDHLHRPSAEH